MPNHRHQKCGRAPFPPPPTAPALARTPGASSRSSSMASLLYRAPLGRPVSPEVPPPHQADLVPRPALLGQVPGAQRTVPRAARVRMAGPRPRLGSRPYRRTMNIPSARCLLVGLDTQRVGRRGFVHLGRIQVRLLQILNLSRRQSRNSLYPERRRRWRMRPHPVFR